MTISKVEGRLVQDAGNRVVHKVVLFAVMGSVQSCEGPGIS